MSARCRSTEQTIQLQLPEGVLEQLLVSSNQRQLAHLACVCKEWRDAVVRSRTQLSANLRSDAGTSSLCAWLQHHATQLQQLQVAHVGTYGRSCHPDTRLRVFQALHAACGSASGAAAAHATTADNMSSDSDEDKLASSLPGHEEQIPLAIAHDAATDEDLSTAQAHGQGQQQASAAIASSQPKVTASPAPKPLQLTHLAATMRLAPADCAAIASLPAPYLSSLQLLGSRTRRLAIDGIRSFLQLQHLTSMTVSKFGIGDDATILLAQNLTQLRMLDLSGNNIGPNGAVGIGKFQTQLQHLDISVNRVKDQGLVALTTLHNLHYLNLHGNMKFSPSALQSLQHFTALTALHLGTNSICNQGLAAVSAALPQLVSLDLANNKIHKVDSITGFVQLSRLVISRNPLQLSCAQVLAGLTSLEELVMFDAVGAKSIVHLSGLAGSMTSLTVGVDPSLNPDDTPNLPLSKTRTCNTLFGALADARKLAVLAVPCCGIADAGAKVLGQFGSSLTALNISYNCLQVDGLKFLKQLPQLQRLELRAMRPELPDDAARVITGTCNRLTLLDLAYNDLSSEGVRQLGCGALSNLQNLNLRNNVQVEKPAIIAASRGLSALTYLNLLELSDVSSRVTRGVVTHADVWAAYPNLQELVVGSYEAMGPFRDARVIFSGA